MDSYVIILTINSLPNSHSLQASNILSQDTIFFIQGNSVDYF